MPRGRRYKIVAIVEGHGEEHAVPIILRRWFEHRRFRNFHTPDLAVRAHQASIVCEYDRDREHGIEHYINLAMRGRPDGILVIFDADKLCIERQNRHPYHPLGPELAERARKHVSHVPVSVVVANREFEAWYLAAYRRLKTFGQFNAGAAFASGFDVESPSDCKGHVARCLGRKYSPTADQRVLAKHIGFGSYMANYSRSFKKLLKDLEWLAKEARRNYR
jgi:hypothetical protein